MERYRVTFMPSERVILAGEGENLLESAMRLGVHINASCGGSGGCGKCRVRIGRGAVESSPSVHLSSGDVEAGFRLACSSRPLSDVTVEVPLTSQVDRSALERRDGPVRTLVPEGREERLGPWSFDPSVRSLFVGLPKPSLDDCVADSERLAREVEAAAGLHLVPPPIGLLRVLGRSLRAWNWRLVLTLQADGPVYRLVHIDGPEQGKRRYILAIDVGTTTVCGELLDGDMCGTLRADPKVGDAMNRSTVARYADYNGQISFGEDVISRIFYARKKGGLKRLQQAVASTIDGLIAGMLLQAGIDGSSVSHVVLAGNTTMMHLLLGIDPTPIMLEPYVPAAKVLPPGQASDMGLGALEPQVPALFVPCVSSYVGGDIVAGVVASGMARSDEVTLFMDLGTNGEIVVGNKDWLVCASCSAGPAFEGGGIGFGMRAGTGAIEQVRINPRTFDPMILTVGKVRPMGICGSGLIDLVAELLETGLIDERGRFRRDCGTERVRDGEGTVEYVLCYGAETQVGRDIVITEVDLDNLMRAKAAMFAGCRVATASVGLDLGEMDRIVIAGGFGHSLDVEKARTIGLLPEAPVDRFVFLGNGSLFGAALCAVSRRFIDESVRVARMMTNLELAASSRFTNEFTAAMFFPHTDGRLFPITTERLWGRRGCAGNEAGTGRR